MGPCVWGQDALIIAMEQVVASIAWEIDVLRIVLVKIAEITA